MSTPRFKARDKRSTQASAAMAQAAAQAMIDAHLQALAPLRVVANGGARSAVDALDALADYSAGMRAIAPAEAIFMATLILGGCTRWGISQAVGCRPGTVSDRVAADPTASRIAAARGCDLTQLDDGSWRVSTRRSGPAAATRPRKPLPRQEL
ncbi:MAG: hypothetical protein H6523_12895 [Mycolicibacterium sp.]|nr:hypothetical protein [Mycolicibacterium sp.]